jgi:hypothetical protein
MTMTEGGERYRALGGGTVGDDSIPRPSQFGGAPGGGAAAEGLAGVRSRDGTPSPAGRQGAGRTGRDGMIFRCPDDARGHGHCRGDDRYCAYDKKRAGMPGALQLPDLQRARALSAAPSSTETGRQRARPW